MAESFPPDPATARPGVILVAHGSSRSGDSAQPVLALARALAHRGFPEVRTAFWKEETFLHQALDAARSRRLVVFPVFLAEGYFSRVVVPRELGLPYGDSDLGVRTVRLLPPLGADPALDRLVVDRARTALTGRAPAGEAELVVLGHGTPSDPGSADAVLATCARLCESSGFTRVAPAFIDQEPRLEQALAEAGPDRVVVVVPFLIAPGFHGGETVPQELAAAGAGRRPLVYAEPIGTHPELVDVVGRLLLSAGIAEPRVSAPAEPPLTALRSVLRERIAEERAVAFLQVQIRRRADDAYAIRHLSDANVRAEDAGLLDLPNTDALTALARRDGDGAHRPLRTAPDLPSGWRHEARGVHALVEALVALYGPAVVHWYLGDRGRLRVREFVEVAARQTGIYAELPLLEPAAVADGVRRVCDRGCLRTRLWEVPGAPARNAPGEHEGSDRGARLVVPCPAPCPILLSVLLGSD